MKGLLANGPGSLTPRYAFLPSGGKPPPVLGPGASGVAHGLPVPIQAGQAGGDHRVRVPLLVACQQAWPVVCDLQAPCVPRANASAEAPAWPLRDDRELAGRFTGS